jgi:hypothetical protein
MLISVHQLPQDQNMNNQRLETKKKNNDVPKRTEDKVYSAVVSPITKMLPDDGPWLKHFATRNKRIS